MKSFGLSGLSILRSFSPRAILRPWIPVTEERATGAHRLQIGRNSVGRPVGESFRLAILALASARVAVVADAGVPYASDARP